MLPAPAAALAAPRVLNGLVEVPLPAGFVLSTYQTTGPTVIVTVPVALFGLLGSSVSVIV